MAGVKGSGHHAEGMSIIHLERDHDRCSTRPRPNVPQSSHPSPPIHSLPWQAHVSPWVLHLLPMYCLLRTK